jgi:hypothetical protein
MAKQPAVCEAGQKWLKGQKLSLGALTGQDWAALKTFLHALDLYCYSDDEGRKHALLAMHHAVRAMQPSTRGFARAAIPYLLDWSDRDTSVAKNSWRNFPRDSGSNLQTASFTNRTPDAARPY